ncbi:hypothetical protein ACLOJK_039011 [Asimina triloba]
MTDHDILGNAAIVDHPNVSTGAHVCPYLALHGFPHAIHPIPSNAMDAVSDSASFHRHPTGLGGPPAGATLNSHVFSNPEQRQPTHHNWQQPSVPFPVSGGALSNTDQPMSQLGSRLSRNDLNSPQRTGSFLQPLPFIHGHFHTAISYDDLSMMVSLATVWMMGTVAHATSNLAAPLLPPVVGDARTHARGHAGHLYQHSTSSSLRSGPFTPTRRVRQRGLTVISSVGANSLPEGGGLYGFSVSGSMNRNPQESEGIGRHFDRFYGWVREGIASLPWIPVEGDSHQWWGPFPPSHNPQTASADSMNWSYFHQRSTPAERAIQGRSDSGGYQRLPHPRMAHFM